MNVTAESTFATWGDFHLEFDCTYVDNSTDLQLLINHFGDQRYVDRLCREYFDPCYFVSVLQSGPLQERIRMVLELGDSQQIDPCEQMHALDITDLNYIIEDCFTFLMFEPSAPPVNGIPHHNN